ncbi:MAG: DUF6701 domain-containing protein, partial [Oceanobacter sp.]
VAPNRRFVVDWNFVRKVGTLQYMHFQVVLYENGQIRYRYGYGNNDGRFATVGLEVSDMDYILYSFDQVRVSPQKDLLFTPLQQPLPDPVASYLFERSLYNGTPGELEDSSGNNLNGRAISPAGQISGVLAEPALEGDPGTCRYTNLTGNDEFFEIPDNPQLDLQTLTASAWIKAESLGNGDLASILSKDTNYEFHLDNQGRVYWWWQAYEAALMPRGRGRQSEPVLVTRTISSPNPVPLNDWHHIAISYQRGAQRLYIDGNLVASESYQGDLLTNNNPLHIGADQWMHGRYFDGDIDEVYLFDQALSQQQIQTLMNTTRPCDLSCDLGGFDIVQPDYGLVCPFSRLQVQIQAMCDDGITLKEDYAGTLQLSSSDASNSRYFDQLSGGSEISAITFDGSESGQASLYLFHQNDQADLAVRVTDVDTGIQTTSSQTTDVASSGFALNWPSNLTCGAEGQLIVTAVGEDKTGTPCQQLTGFSGNKALKAWTDVSLVSGSSGYIPSSPLIVNGQSLSAWSEPPASNLTLNFDQGRAEVSMRYDNAARLNSLQLKYDRPLVPGGVRQMSGSSASLLSLPSQMVWSADAASACPSEDASCSAFVSAGTAFPLTLEAQCQGGSVATDFLADVALGIGLVSPSGGQTATLGQTAIRFEANDGGSRTFNQSISEVGVHRLSAETSYFGLALVAADLTVGRITPHQFRLASPMLTQACDSFLYMDQPGSRATLTLSAENAQGQVVQNYDGAYAKGSLSWMAENANSGVDLSNRLLAGHSPVWSNGRITDVVNLAFTRPNAVQAPDGPYGALEVGISINDPDASLIDLDMNTNTSGDCDLSNDCTGKRIGTADVRFGVMMAEDAYGPETRSLTQNISSWYFDGSRFVQNVDDQCSLVDLARMTAREWRNGLSAGQTTTSINTSWADGKGSIQHSAPGLGTTGSVIYRYQPPAWLTLDVNGDGDYSEASDSEITFGQYRGTDRVIFWREVIRQ